MSQGKEVELKVGRRSIDGTVRLSGHPPQLLQLTVSYKGERASSVVLTRTQLRALQQALAEFEETMTAETGSLEGWDQEERRNRSHPAG